MFCLNYANTNYLKNFIWRFIELFFVRFGRNILYVHTLMHFYFMEITLPRNFYYITIKKIEELLPKLKSMHEILKRDKRETDSIKICSQSFLIK